MCFDHTCSQFVPLFHKYSYNMQPENVCMPAHKSETPAAHIGARREWLQAPGSAQRAPGVPVPRSSPRCVQGAPRNSRGTATPNTSANPPQDRKHHVILTLPPACKPTNQATCIGHCVVPTRGLVIPTKRRPRHVP